METKKVIKTSIDNFTFTYFKDDMEIAHLVNRDDLKSFKKEDRIYVLMETTAFAFENLLDLLKIDLEDIWERLDKIENK